MKAALAIYDMDRTITRTGTYTPFLLHAARRIAPWRLLLAPVALLAMLAYAVKLIDRKRLKEINQALLLGRHIHAWELAPVTASFADRIMRFNVHPGALAAIAADHAAGRKLVLATASYRLYVEAIAERLGFDEVIATNSLIGLDTRIRAKIDGENCYGPAKLRMVTDWLSKSGFERGHIRFYSDHASDAPVFEWSDEPVAVNPHSRLSKLAGERGWAVEDWS